MYLCWKEGVITEASEAQVNARDIGMLRGYGVYDGITVINGKGSHMEGHLQRFRTSAEGLALAVPLSDQEIIDAVSALAERYDGKRFNVRLILTGGQLFNGLEFDAAQSTFYILSEPHAPPPPERYTEGGTLITYEHARQYAQYKTINYIAAVMAAIERKKTGADEALFISNGNALECSTSNFFIVKNGEVITPAAGILPGIARKAIIGLFAAKDIQVAQRAISIDEVMSADEVFITGSFKDILPIVTIDQKQIGDGKVGPISADIVATFAEHLADGSPDL